MRLIRVGREDLTVTRQKRGTGFCFYDKARVAITDPAFKARVKALGIPPAWTAVRIAASEKAHIQVIGHDEAGREQYLYHPEWTLRRDSKKQLRLAALTTHLPQLRRRVNQGLAAAPGSRELAMALAVALIDKTAMRLGREKYLEASGTRGAGTLYARDVTVSGDEICLRFDAKGGKRAEYCLSDSRLASAITAIKSLPGRRLLVYRDDAGKVRPIKTSAINDYLRSISGAEISAKDFRTLHASAIAGAALARLEVGQTEAARRRQMAQVAREVASVLRNTPMISRKSYIAPCLFKLFNEGKLQALWQAAGGGKAGLMARERRLGAVLAAVG